MVIDNNVLIKGQIINLPGCIFKTSGNDGIGVRAPLTQPGFQNRHGRGIDKDTNRPGIGLADLPGPLDINIQQQGISLEQAAEQRAASIPAGRYGTRQEFGATCAFLCSQHAGFIIGQNILLDGGATVATI